jgi:hypothetical protein
MKRFVIAVILLGLIPQAAIAAWWNPASWFKKPSLVHEEVSESLSNALSTVSTTSDIEVRTEKIIERIIVQPDKAVIEENIKLKNKIAELQAKLDQLTKSASDYEKRKRELSAEISGIESLMDKVMIFGIYCEETEVNSLNCLSNLTDQQRADKVIELESKKTEFVSELKKLEVNGF